MIKSKGKLNIFEVDPSNDSATALPHLSRSNATSTRTKLVCEEEEVVKKLSFLEFTNFRNLRSEMKENLFFSRPVNKLSTSTCTQSENQKLTIRDSEFQQKTEQFQINNLRNTISKEFTQKINNINIEAKLAQELKFVLVQIKDLDEINLDLNKTLEETNKAFAELQLELEYYTRYHPLMKNKEELLYMLYQEIITNNSAKGDKVVIPDLPALTAGSFKFQDLGNEMQIQINQQKNKLEDKRMKEVNRINSKLSLLYMQKEQTLREYKNLENEYTQYFKAEIEIKQLLVSHYHKLLTEGRDTRGVGLVWIIKEVYMLGYDVITSYMPSFLDDKAVAYLFIYAQMSMEKQKITDVINGLKKDLKDLNEDYYELEKAFKKVNLDSPVVTGGSRTSNKFFKVTTDKNSETRVRSETINTESNSSVVDKYREQIALAKLANLARANKSSFKKGTPSIINLTKIIESPIVKFKMRNHKESSNLDPIPELETLSSRIDNIKSQTTLDTTYGNPNDIYKQKVAQEKLENMIRVRQLSERQSKINKYMDTKLSSKLNKSQKEFLLVEKAIRAGLGENEMRQLNFKLIEKYLDSKQHLNPESMELIKQISKEESKLNSIDKRIAKLKSAELDRIFKEILYFDYLRRFDTTKKAVICAIVGEEALFEELLREERETKVR